MSKKQNRRPRNFHRLPNEPGRWERCCDPNRCTVHQVLGTGILMASFDGATLCPVNDLDEGGWRCIRRGAAPLRRADSGRSEEEPGVWSDVCVEAYEVVRDSKRAKIKREIDAQTEEGGRC